LNNLALTKYEESTLEAEPTEEPTKEVNGDVAQDQTLADTSRTELEAKNSLQTFLLYKQS
jgi:hypothetical protein